MNKQAWPGHVRGINTALRLHGCIGAGMGPTSGSAPGVGTGMLWGNWDALGKPGEGQLTRAALRTIAVMSTHGIAQVG